MIPKIQVNDLPVAFEYLLSSSISSKTLDECLKNPIYVLLYNEIMLFNTEELENLKYKKRNFNLYKISKQIKNPLFYMAGLEKRIFWKDVPTNIQWILNTIEKPSLELYDNIYQYFSFSSSDNTFEGYQNQHLESVKKDPIFNFMLFFCNKINNEEKEKLSLSFCDVFLLSHYKTILTEHLQSSNSEFFKFVVENLIKKNININENFPLNSFLTKNNGSKRFFISSLEISHIVRLLDMGFRFDETFTLNGDNLLNCVISSNRKDIIFGILPYLNNLHNQELTQTSKNVLNRNNEFNLFYKQVKTEHLKKHLEDTLISQNKKSQIKI